MATKLAVFVGVVVCVSSAAAVGVYWGTAASHPLAAETVVRLLKANNFTRVRISAADPPVLEALSGSGVGVTVGVPNAMLRALNSSAKAAQSWVHDNVTRYISTLRIEYVAVGDEPFLQSYGEQFRPYVVGAAINIQTALQRANLEGRVKVVVPCSSDAFLSESGLPSRGHFRSDLNNTITQLLGFLTRHGSPFFATISPFLTFRQNKNTSLDFALFRETAKPCRDGRRTYRNSFETSYDTLVTALSGLGFPRIDIVVAQIGWPTDGAPNATPASAEAFIRGLTGQLHGRSGTPLRPKNPPLETYVLGLLDEDRRSTVAGGFERHWGIFTFDGQAKYRLDFGQGLRTLVNARDVDYLPAKWCVANDNKDSSNASVRASEACSGADCTALLPGGSCSNISWPGNVSYAFNSYYQQHGQSADSCDFGGLGLITTVDPSVSNCRFPIGLGASRSRSLQKGSVLVRTTVRGFVVAAILLLLGAC